MADNVEKTSENGWGEWSRYVLKELERRDTNEKEINDEINKFKLEMQKELGSLQTEIALLKMRASMWGFAAGAIPVLILVIAKATGIY